MTREVRRGRCTALLVAAAMVVTVAPVPSLAADPLPEGFTRCPTGADPSRSTGRVDRTPLPFDWSGEVDAGGTIRSHTLRLGGSRTWRSGPRGFADGPFRERLVTGERDDGGTNVRVLDLAGGCVSQALRLDSLVYGSVVAPDGTVYVSTVAATDRRELGIWRIRPEGGEPGRVIPPPVGAVARAVPRTLDLQLTADGVRATWCAVDGCVAAATTADQGAVAIDLDPSDDSTSAMPMSDLRPVPIYDRWGTWTVLDFRFHPIDTPPSWMREALLAAAEDATDTSSALSPIFIPTDGSSNGTLRYTESFPSACSTSIACASHDADHWTLRMRPHGYDFRWGTLRWCQKYSVDGCFDAEHVALHEFGHAIGLDHPESAGYHLPSYATVMHQVTPARPAASWSRHSFGVCDVASLQEQFGLPTMSTRVSTCNDVSTTLTLTATDTSLTVGQQVTFKATLRVKGSAAYGALSGMRLNGRSVQLRRRPIGSTGSWTTSWMRSTDTPGVYSLTLQPSRSYEIRAVFPTPDDEGLRGASTDDIDVRVTGTPTCTGTCPNEEVDPT